METCTFCKAESKLVWKEKEYRVYCCRLCGSASLKPVPANIHSVYNELYFRRWYLSTIHSRRRYLKQLFSSLRRCLPAGRKLLDVGCGVGIFLEIARDEGWEAIGVEISPFATNWCRQLGFTVIHAPLTAANLPSASFDLVTLWDVLAHVPEAPAYLETVRRLLKPGGAVLIKTPSHPAGLFRLARVFSFTGKSRSLLHIPAQIHHFNPSSLMKILLAANFHRIKILKVREHPAAKISAKSFPLSSFSFLTKRWTTSRFWWPSLVAIGFVSDDGKNLGK
ncbi:MAG: class I SAM-dependent methyltransferase [Candidatus Omnitrophica bacterium]|nr:class I SAM-dependent methyltransferase [Candidatus Omnitrophota bacterium]